jgi:hypothetical protein
MFTPVTGSGLNLNALLRNFRASSLVNLKQTPVPTAFLPLIRFIPFVRRAVVFPSPSQDSHPTLELWGYSIAGGTGIWSVGTLRTC